MCVFREIDTLTVRRIIDLVDLTPTLGMKVVCESELEANSKGSVAFGNLNSSGLAMVGALFLSLPVVGRTGGPRELR